MQVRMSSNMTEASLNGYVVDFYITIREEDLKCLFIIKHIVDSSHHHLAILLRVLLILHSLQCLHDGLNNEATVLQRNFSRASPFLPLSSANSLIFCEFSTDPTHAFSATILHSSVLFPHEVSLFQTWFLRFPALLLYSRPSKKPQQISRQQPLVPTLLLELGENQPRKQVSTSTVLVKVLHHLFEVFLCFHNSDF